MAWIDTHWIAFIFGAIVFGLIFAADRYVFGDGPRTEAVQAKERFFRRDTVAVAATKAEAHRRACCAAAEAMIEGRAK